MNSADALDQISEIHKHLAKSEVYRGYRSLPVALSGVVGFVAAWLQAPGLGANDPVGFVVFWSAIAAVSVVLGSSEIVFNYVFREPAFERRKTRIVAAQFTPAVVVGAIATVILPRLSAALVPLLPGLWASLFGVAIFAARPYLPRATGWVALYYLVMGGWLLWHAAAGPPSPWSVGGTFGAGQIFAALVLYWNLERRNGWDAQPEM
jgi:hypothetical protein